MTAKWLTKEPPAKSINKYEQPEYPTLFTEQQELSMTPEDLSNEVEWIISRSTNGLTPEGAYIYSVQTVEPLNVSRFIQLDDLAGTPEDCVKAATGGYFYHSNLYGQDKSALWKALVALSSVSSIMEVALRRATSSPAERKRIVIKPSKQSSKLAVPT